MTDDRKASIVAAAFDVLFNEGLPDLSYKKIAEAAGLTRQLVRYHFPDPDDLMVALCDHIATVYREDLIAAMSARDPGNRIELFLDYYFDLLETPKKPRDDQVYDAMMALSAGSERIKSNLRSQYTLLGQVVSHELRQQYPEIPLPACEQLSFAFVSLMYGHWKMVASLGLHEDHKHVSRAVFQRLIESYVNDPTEAACENTWKPNN